eukprot:CAMPEP_0115006824 /NCGR_PEP_ID=MMETSP0216-20121206/20746_1 /TAXON_ID=223996 /ORGANISM="Protocruzia adherens, Strain Boccale" /LENGTH=33 /DNA_ID= /DNA_START= /DNA_END= /DNA_ORIENTATION=
MGSYLSSSDYDANHVEPKTDNDFNVQIVIDTTG